MKQSRDSAVLVLYGTGTAVPGTAEANGFTGGYSVRNIHETRDAARSSHSACATCSAATDP